MATQPVSCLENSMDRRAWRATVHGVSESDMTERQTLSTTRPLLPTPRLPTCQGLGCLCDLRVKAWCGRKRLCLASG